MSQARCPDPMCAAVFAVAPQRLGRNMTCPVCGIGLTARPLAVMDKLKAQETRVGSSSGADVPRLPLAVMVDNVRSLWNVGSMFRTADACGVRQMILSGITASPPRREITKTALGAEDAVAWTYHADSMDALATLQAAGYTPVALENTIRAVPLGRMEWPRQIALIVGNEVAGISPAVLEACPHHVSIPMRGVKDSLNVAVAFGIAAHAAAEALANGSSR